MAVLRMAVDDLDATLERLAPHGCQVLREGLLVGLAEQRERA